MIAAATAASALSVRAAHRRRSFIIELLSSLSIVRTCHHCHRQEQ